MAAAVAMVMLIAMLGMGCLDAKESFAAEDGYEDGYVCFLTQKNSRPSVKSTSPLLELDGPTLVQAVWNMKLPPS